MRTRMKKIRINIPYHMQHSYTLCGATFTQWIHAKTYLKHAVAAWMLHSA
jgi:hypothetical protein